MLLTDPIDPPPRILAVDDTPDGLELIKLILEDEGYDIRLATDGITALSEVDKDPPDLIMLDVMMPKMSGIEVTRALRQRLGVPFIPILLITAYENSSLVEGLDAGADDFVYKPVEVDELLARVRALLRLKKSIDSQLALSRQREDFISRLTHDLRTPLIAMERVLELMREETFGSLPAEAAMMLRRVVRTNHNLQDMVDTLLEVHRHEAGYKRMTFLSIDIIKIAGDVLEELAPLAQEKQLELKLTDRTGEQSFEVLGDQLELRRVMTNLVENAIKFSDQGTVELSLATDPVPPTVLIEVRDTGPGIPPEEQAVLFSRFHQGRHTRAGHGLGLHLCRLIAEAHNGSITCQSVVGEGSTFTLRLPLRPSDHPLSMSEFHLIREQTL